MDCVVCGSREGASLDRPSNSSSNRSANNSIGRHIYFVGNIPSLTSKAIRSGRNILNICFVHFVLTIAVAIYLAAASVGKHTMYRLLFNLLQSGLCFAIRLSTASFIYSCFDMFVVKRNTCSRMHVHVVNSRKM